MPSLTLTTPISRYMTQSPLRVDSTTTIAQAIEIMTKAKIRHLPVTRSRKVVGLLCLKDLQATVSQSRLDINKEIVEAVMEKDPWRVPATATLADVTIHMAQNRLHSAVIVDESDEVVGIFTEVDALKLIHEICQDSSKYA